MMTVGGIIVDTGHKDRFPLSYVEATLPFVKTGDEPYLIKVPSLTYREIRYLDKFLPNEKDALEQDLNIPSEHVNQYAATYRYFPNFADTDY
jgi:hypothetical protein